MTTEYKLLLNDTCTFTPLDQKKGEDVLRFEIVIKNPKTLMAYEVWNHDTPKANAGTSKIFSIAPTVLYNCINNYNAKVKGVDGFTYKPTAIVVLGNIGPESKNEGGLLVIDSINGGWNEDTYDPFMIISAHSRHGPELAEIAPFPTEPFNGKIRMNISGLQSTALLGVLDNEFIEGWLKPTYNKLEPYPYVGEECVENPEKSLSNRERPGFNFAYGGYVSIKNISSGLSRITVTNALQTVQYQTWNPLTPYDNKKDLYGAALVPLSNVYSIFKDSEKNVIDKGLPVNEYAWRPVTTFDVIDDKGNNLTYVGRIVNIESELGEPNEAPKIMIDVDTRNFELYKNKRLPSLPSGEFLVLMDIDYFNVPPCAPSLSAKICSQLQGRVESQQEDPPPSVSPPCDGGEACDGDGLG